jgi:hypothetical protein
MPTSKSVLLRITPVSPTRPDVSNNNAALTHAQLDANFGYIIDRLDTEAVTYGVATGGGAATYTLPVPFNSLTGVVGKIFTFTTPAVVNSGAGPWTLTLSTPSSGTLANFPIKKKGQNIVAGELAASKTVCVMLTADNTFELLSDDNSLGYRELQQDLSAGTINWGFDEVPVGNLQLSATSNFNTITSGKRGQYASVRIVQDLVTPRTVSFNGSGNIYFKGTNDFTLSTGLGEVDWLLFRISEDFNGTSAVAELVGFRNNIGVA